MIPRHGPVMSTQINAQIATAVTIATPPIRGTGRLCTRGRSARSSIPPTNGAMRPTSGVSATTMTAATAKPMAAGLSTTRARTDSWKDIRRV